MNFLSYIRELREQLVSSPRARSRRRNGGPAARPWRSVVPGVEALECRITPATNRWIGAAASGPFLWSNPTNWSLGRPPINGDDLVFGTVANAAALTTRNDMTGLVLNSVTIQTSSYNIAPNSAGNNGITLNNLSAGDSVIVNAGALNNIISLDVTLGGTATRQFFDVGAGGSVTLSGQLLGSTGIELDKDGFGNLTLSHDNSTFTGPITVEQGILAITNANALGTTSAPTTVQQNAQLQTLGITTPINEPLLLNGPGITNSGALLDADQSGTTTWAGPIELDSDASIGAYFNSVLNITGVISDTGAGHNLTINGNGAPTPQPLATTGKVIFSHVGGNTYRGLTTISNGILTIRDPLSLGPASGTAAGGTLVNSHPTTGSGTLQIDGTTNGGSGFIVLNEILTLNGPGFNPGSGVLGALHNLSGNNEWAFFVNLGSPAPNNSAVNIGVAANTNLTVSGVVQDPNTINALTKILPGKLIFNNANTYRGFTTVATGTLNIRDSQGLGSTAAATTVLTGAALELEVDTGLDPHNRDLSNDSIVGQTGNGPQLGLRIFENLTINGTGINNTGALHSLSGINQWRGHPTVPPPQITSIITLASADAGIGVEPDPNPSNTYLYFTNDYSLTVGDPANVLTSQITGGATFHKEDLGHLILPYANTYTGNTQIEQGWVTIQNDQSLGTYVYGSDTVQPTATVSTGAALHLKPLVLGIAGAAENGSTVTITTPSTHTLLVGDTVQITGFTGLAAGYNGTFTVATVPTANTFTYKDNATGLPASGGGSVYADLTVVRNLVLSGTGITHAVGNQAASTNFPLIDRKGALMSLGGVNSVGGPFDVTPSSAQPNIRSSDIQVNVNTGIGVELTDPTDPTISELSITSTITDLGTNKGGITKLGSKRLNLQGDGAYSGAVNVNEGVLRAQNDTALGLASSGTNPGVPVGNQTYTTTTTTVGTGIQEVQTLTVTGGPGTFQLAFKTDTTGPLTIQANGTLPTAAAVQAALNALPSIQNTANGGGGSVLVSLAQNIYAVTFQGTLSGLNQPALTVSVNPAPPAVGPIVAVDTLMNGDGAALELKEGTNTLNGGLAPGLNIWNEQLIVGIPGFLGYPGNAQFGDAPLTVLSSDHMWRGPVTLRRGTAVEVKPNARVHLYGVVDDNTSAGVQNLILTGENGIPAVQKVTVTGSGTFTLNFNGESTPALATGLNPASVADALNNLSTIGGVGGAVTVTKSGNDYTITFGASLLGSDLASTNLSLLGAGVPPLIATASPGATATVATVAPGSGGLAGELALTGQNTFRGTTFVNQGALDVENGQALGGIGVAETQTITLSGATTGSFSLTFNGQFTGSLPFNIPASGGVGPLASVQNALNALGTIGGVGGSVTVTRSGNVFTVVFGGSQAGYNQPALVAAGVGGTNAVIGTLTDGAGGTVVANGAALQLQGSITVSGEPLIMRGKGASTQYQTITVKPWNSGGTYRLGFGGVFSLTNLAANTDTGVGTGNTATTIQNALNALSTIGGVGGSVSVVLSSRDANTAVFTVTFGGTLANSQVPLIQDLVSNPPAGDWVTEAAVANAVPANWFNLGPAPINAGQNVGQTAGNEAVTGRITGVAVDPTDANVIYIATAGGGAWKTKDSGHTWERLFDASAVQRLYVPAKTGTITLSFNGNTTGTLNLNSTTLAADIQAALNKLPTIGGLQPVPGSVTVTQSAVNDLVFDIRFGASLSVPNLPAITGTSLTAGIANPTVTNPTAVMYGGAIAVDPNDPRIIYFGTGEANNGSPAPQNEVQSIIVSPWANGGTYRLSFNGAIAPPITPPPPLPPFPADTDTGVGVGNTATTIQAALNALPTIGGVGGFVNVILASLTSTTAVFNVTFGGALAASPQPLIQDIVSNPPTGDWVTEVERARGYNGPVDTLGNPVSGNPDSFAGSGVYQSFDSGRTWTLLTNSDGSNPVAGLGISKIVVDYGTPPADPFTPPQPNWPASEAGLNSPTGRIYVATTDLVTNYNGTSTPGVYRFETAAPQVQTLTVPTRTGSGTFRLTFPNRFGVTGTTASIPVNSPNLAQAIQDALNAPAMLSIGGFNTAQGSGHAVVTASAVNPLVFEIALMGVLMQVDAPGDQTSAVVAPQLPITPIPATDLIVARGTGIPDPQVSRASTWVNLTSTPSAPRLAFAGTPGPNDDLRLRFPQGFAAGDVGVNWSDLSLVYIDDLDGETIPHGGGTMVPVLYAALGTPNAYFNGFLFPYTDNAVYRTENPALAPISAAATNWNVGDPGVPLDEIQQITVNPTDMGGFYRLSFNGSAFYPLPGDATFPNGLPATATAQQVQRVLEHIPTIGDVGGNVVVTLDAASTATSNVFDVEFLGTLANFQEPLLTAQFTNPPTVTISELQAGLAVDAEAHEFPNWWDGFNNGNIKISTFIIPNPLHTLGFVPAFEEVNLYAAVANWTATDADASAFGVYVLNGATNGISTDWLTFATPNYMANQGNYNSTILAVNQTSVYVGGHESDPTTHQDQIFFSGNGGAAWGPLSVDANGKGPHTSQHALAVDIQGRLLFGGDGGLWRLDPNGTTPNLWSDLNGNLAISQVNGVAGSPTNVNVAFAGTRYNGTNSFTNNLAWTESDSNDGGQVHINPQNPNIVYHVQDNTLFTPTASTAAAAVLRRSTTGGSAGSWTTLPLLDSPFSARYFPFLIDPINTSRLLVGGGDSAGIPFPNGGGGRRRFDPNTGQPVGVPLQESLDGGNTWFDLNAGGGLDNANHTLPTAPPPVWYEITAVAAATFQGVFQPDPAFPLVTDLGSNTYDPDTIYVLSKDYWDSVQRLLVTKNHGRTWEDRTPLVSPTAAEKMVDIAVDPTSRDTIYVVGSGGVWMSTTAGRDPDGSGPLPAWTNITFNLGDTPLWKIVIDPRHVDPVTGTKDLYVGTDHGVFFLAAGSSTWQQFGGGLANVQVKDLELNQQTNTLLAGTYGRSMYQLTMADGAANAGALRAVSGSSVWTGPVFLVGDPINNETWVGANGSPTLLNGITTAQLNVVGTISDLTPLPVAPTNNNPTLVKVGLGDVILSGANNNSSAPLLGYHGVTEVREGALVVHNPFALGDPSPTANTIVDAGTSLELATDLALEPVVLHGDGVQPPFNGHNTGALRNISNFNTYTGPLTLATNVTIGVDSGSSLTIGTKANLPGTGTIQDDAAGANWTLTKELVGTLILASDNTSTGVSGVGYGGKTQVFAGALQVRHPKALGSTVNGTDVFDGAQLQLQTPAGSPPVVVSGEILMLSGTGIHNTGALLNTGGNNTWQGPIILDSQPVLILPNKFAATVPPLNVAIGTLNDGDNLTIDGVIGQIRPSYGLIIGDPERTDLGRVILNQANTYGGLTTVKSGELRIRNNNALGTAAGNTPPFVTISPNNNGSQGYAGLSFTQGGGFVPPDSQGAAGPVAYVETVNQTIALFPDKYDSSGVQTSSLSNFFRAVGGLPATPGGRLSDPVVVYNELIGRFIVGDQDVNLFSNVSNFDLAVSKTSNPTSLTAADWNFYQISTTEAGYDADFPGNMGYNADALVFTLNMSGPTDHVLVTSVNASDLANGVPQASLRVFRNDVTDFNLRPTTMHTAQAGDPMWLVAETGDGQHVTVYKMTNVLSNGAIFTTTQLQVNDYADIGTAPPRQPNGSVITFNIDSRIQKAALSGNTLVATHAVSLSATMAAARWYAIDVSGPTPVIQQQGDVSLGNNTYAFYPAIDINPVGNIGMTFIGSGTGVGQFMSAFVTGRTPTDPLGTMEAPILIPSGIGQANSNDGRAGDLSGINIDPVDGSFWAINEFTTSAFGGQWGTAVANFNMAATSDGTIVLAGAALELDGDPSGVGASLNVAPEALTLNGLGVGGTGALRNITGNNTWTGTVALQTNTAVGVDPTTQLTTTGLVKDYSPLPVPAASLSKVGPGTLVFPNLNPYSGKTFVNDGVLNIRNPGALGISPPEQQTVTVLGAGGTFNLSFKGNFTPALSVLSPTLRYDMEAALNGLPGIGGPVTVTQAPAPNSNVFTVTFGPQSFDLGLDNQPALNWRGTPGVSVVIKTIQDGPEGTLVNSGGTLQLQGLGAPMTNEALTLNGLGFNNGGALENVSGNNTWQRPITLGSNASIGVDNGGETLTINQGIGQSSPGFGVTKFGVGTLLYSNAAFGTFDNTYTGLTQVNSGILLLQKAAAPEVQILTLFPAVPPGAPAGSTFTLTFKGSLAGPFNPNSGTLATEIQNALNAASYPPIGGVGGTVSVVPVASPLPTGRTFTITFGGSLINSNQPPITPQGFGGVTASVSTLTDGSTGVDTAIAGNLTIGDTVSGNSLVQWLNSHQVVDTSHATVNNDGTLDLNGKTDTVGQLSILDGLATTGATGSGALTVSGLDMTGGKIDLTTAGGRLLLNGNVTATSSATIPSASNTALITGSGQVSLNGATRTFTVNDGAQPIDLLVDSVISGTGTEGLFKDGPGLMQLTNNETYTGLTTVRAGKLQVDGLIDDVSLTGGTLQGIGFVGAIDGTGGGTVAPGDSPGILHSGSVNWNASTNFSVEIFGTALGSQYDQLQVTGTTNLGGANLIVSLGSPLFVPVTTTDSFTILTSTGLISGTFAQGSVIFVNGMKFGITYNQHSVVLNRIPAETSTAMTSVHLDRATSLVTFTATVTPEAQATFGSPGGTVTFKDRGNTVTIGTANVGAGGVATLTSVTLASLGLSPHDVTATYSGDNDFNGSGPSAAFTFGDQKVTTVTPGSPVLVPPLSGLTTVTINFNRPVNTVDTPNINTPGAIRLLNPVGTAIPFTLTSVTTTQWKLTFASQTTSGVYTLVVGPEIADAANFPMDQNGNGTNGEPLPAPTGDQFTRSIVINGLAVVPGGFTPSSATVAAVGVGSSTITFNMAVASFPLTSLTFTGPNGVIQLADALGNPLPGVALTDTNPGAAGDTIWRLDYPVQHTAGFYTLVVGPNLFDRAGNAMNQNHNTTFGDAGVAPVGDAFAGTFFIQGLKVTSIVPTNPVVASRGSVTITFNEAVLPSSFDPTDFKLLDPSGNLVALGNPALSDTNSPADTVWQLDFDKPATPGVYTLFVGPHIQDAAAQKEMDQNSNGILGEDPGDRVQTQFVVDGLAVRDIVIPPTAPLASAGLSSIIINFNMAVIPSSFTASDVLLFDPTGAQVALTDGSGNPLPGVSLASNNADNSQWLLSFPAQHKPGFYTVKIGPDVRDLLGDQMNQNHDNTFGTAGDAPAGDRFSSDALVPRPLLVQGLAISSMTATNPVISGNGTVNITFNQAVNPTTFTKDQDIQLLDPNGAVVNPLPLGTTLTNLNPGTDTNWRLLLPKPATPGVYTVRVGPHIADRLTNSEMDQNSDGNLGQSGLTPAGDQAQTRFVVDGLAVTGISPATGLGSPGVSALTVDFNMAVDPGSLAPTDFVITDPSNNPVSLVGATLMPTNANNSQWQLVFPALHQPGTYGVKIGPDVRDVIGDQMNQNHNTTFGDTVPNFVPDDTFSGTFFIQGLQITNLGVPNPMVTAIGTTTITFNYAVDPATFTLADVKLTDANNNVIALTDGGGNPLPNVSLTHDATNAIWTLNFPKPATPGAYTLVVGPHIADQNGFELDQNGDANPGQNGITPNGDQVQGQFIVDGLKVLSMTTTPANPVPFTVGVTSVTFTFNMKVVSFPLNGMTLTGPSGAVPLTGASLTPDSTGTVWKLTFAQPLGTGSTTAGHYTLAVGPAVTGGPSPLDVLGDPMNQNGNGTFGEPGAAPGGDQFVGTLDVTGLKVTSITPTAAVLDSVGLASATITFNAAVTSANFHMSDVTLQRPSGSLVTLTSLAPTDATNTNWRVVFPKQTQLGNYTLSVGPNVPNLDQNDNGTPNEPGTTPVGGPPGSGDVATGTLTVDGLHVVTANADATLVPPGFSAISLTFNEGVQATPVGQPAFRTQVTLTGPAGNIAVTVTDLTQGNTNLHDNWQVTFATQTVGGNYTLTIGANVFDLAGNRIDQNQNHVPGESPGDVFATTYTVINPTPPPDNGGTTPLPIVGPVDKSLITYLQSPLRRVNARTARMLKRQFGVSVRPGQNLFFQTVTLFNPNTRPILGPIALVLDGLDPRIKLRNRVGTIGTGQAVLGTLSGDQLNSFQGEAFVLLFKIPKKSIPFGYSFSFLAGFGR
jgi:autotransporter-associated beta strand protein